MTMPEFPKTRLREWHDQRILRKEFKLRELVILYKSRWSSPYTIIIVTPFGAVTLKTESRNEFKGNG